MTSHLNQLVLGAKDKDDKDKDESKGNIAEQLFEAREILLTGAVMDKTARPVIAQLLAMEAANPKAPITLILNSPGGSVSDGFAIYDTIRFIRPPVRILTTGMCASIATIILIAAPKEHRACTPNTRLLIHQPHIPGQGFGSASDVEIHATEILKTREKLNQMLAKACGQPIERVSKDTQRDFWMSSSEALEYGLVTHIVSSRDEFEKATGAA